MSLTVTVHEGELRQIKQHIAEKRIESGHLFGLWTHSNQPVVQYITGSLKDEDEEELFKPHALRRVGIWSTKESGGKKRNSVLLGEVTVSILLYVLKSTTSTTFARFVSSLI